MVDSSDFALMKPKDLKSPYSWEERHPLLVDRIFFIPEHYDNHSSFSLPDWKTLFGKEGRVHLEFCSGNGKWVLERASDHPGIHWVACEIQFDRVRKIWSKMKNGNISNLWIVAGEAYTFSSNYLQEESVDEIFINFPDPWPKRRHEKWRLMKPSFIAELYRILKRGGKVTFVTDDENYRAWTMRHFLESSFQPLHPFPHYITDIPDYGTSYFDTLWRGQGKTISFLEFVKA